MHDISYRWLLSILAWIKLTQKESYGEQVADDLDGKLIQVREVASTGGRQLLG